MHRKWGDLNVIAKYPHRDENLGQNMKGSSEGKRHSGWSGTSHIGAWDMMGLGTAAVVPDIPASHPHRASTLKIRTVTEVPEMTGNHAITMEDSPVSSPSQQESAMMKDH